MKAALAGRGMAGLFPLDEELHPSDYRDPAGLALAIAASCEAQIRKADMGIFNVQPWRGPEADEGTAYELGFMAALGKPVVLYTNDPRPFAERIATDVYQGDVYRDGDFVRGKRDHMMIEDFEGFAGNLMLINAAVRIRPSPSRRRRQPCRRGASEFRGCRRLRKKALAASE